MQVTHDEIHTAMLLVPLPCLTPSVHDNPSSHLSLMIDITRPPSTSQTIPPKSHTPIPVTISCDFLKIGTVDFTQPHVHISHMTLIPVFHPIPLPHCQEVAGIPLFTLPSRYLDSTFTQALYNPYMYFCMFVSLYI